MPRSIPDMVYAALFKENYRHRAISGCSKVISAAYSDEFLIHSRQGTGYALSTIRAETERMSSRMMNGRDSDGGLTDRQAVYGAMRAEYRESGRAGMVGAYQGIQ